MNYAITEDDKILMLQPSINYKYKLIVLDKNKNYIDEIIGISNIGSYAINPDSDIRRTISFTLFLDVYNSDISIEQKLFTWIGYNFLVQIGIYSMKDDEYKWFDCGYYLITEANTSYSSVDNSITLNLSDWYANLNGLRNGQLGGAPIISIPNYDENNNPVIIKKLTEDILKHLAGINDYIIEDVGEPKALPKFNENYQEYRELQPLWNQLPYDLEYSIGAYVSEILEEIKNLYPNYEMYFDIFGNFCFNMIPSRDNDMAILDNDYIQSILLSESTETVDYNIESIKNITEVFGHSYEVDRYTDNCKIIDTTYHITLEEYEAYDKGDYIGFVAPDVNVVNMSFKINELEELPLYKEFTEEYVEPNTLEKGKTYVVKIAQQGTELVAYYLGQFQPHALCVLSDNADDTRYTIKYFAEKYNCDERNVLIRIEPDSPFSVQKIGEVLETKTGEEFDNILSDSVAIENAKYYNKISSSVFDTITIRTKMIPFLDVNLKVEYKKQQDNVINQYIIKNISNEIESCTSTITLMRFYPLFFVEKPSISYDPRYGQVYIPNINTWVNINLGFKPSRLVIFQRNHYGARVHGIYNKELYGEAVNMYHSDDWGYTTWYSLHGAYNGKYDWLEITDTGFRIRMCTNYNYTEKENNYIHYFAEM